MAEKESSIVSGGLDLKQHVSEGEPTPERRVSPRDWEIMVLTDPTFARERVGDLFGPDIAPYVRASLAGRSTVDFTGLPSNQIFLNRLNVLYGNEGPAPNIRTAELPDVPAIIIHGDEVAQEGMPLPQLETRPEGERRSSAGFTPESNGPEQRCLAMFVDLNGFKGANDLLGHAEGDELLISVGETIGRVFRYANRPFGEGDDLVAHRSGDEFVVVMFGLSSQEARAVVARFVDVLREVATPNSLEQGVAVDGCVAGAYGQASEYAEVLSLINAADEGVKEQKSRMQRQRGEPVRTVPIPKRAK